MYYSRYNVTKTIGDTTWLYNTRTTSFIKIDTATWEHIFEAEQKEAQEVLLREGFLTNNADDELKCYKYQYYLRSFRQKALNLTIAPTMQCNFDCFYCFEGQHKVAPTMTDEVEAALVKYIVANGKDGVAINWFGGEPLLAWPRIQSIFKQLSEREITFTSSMVTNGSLLTPDKIAQLADLHLTHIQISMDGTAAMHDQRRCFKNGAPSYDIIMRHIDCLLTTTDIPLVVQVTMDHNNDGAYEALRTELANRYPEAVVKRQLQVGCIHVQNRTGFDTCGTCFSDTELYQQKVDALRAGATDSEAPYMPRMSLPCMYRSVGVYAIDAEGYIYHCPEHLGDSSKAIGSLSSGTLSLEKLAATTFAEDPFEDEVCQSCNVFPVCGGGCPLDRIAAKQKGGDRPCSLYKAHLADLLPEYYQRYFTK